MPRLRLAPDGPGTIRIDRADGAVEAVLLSIPSAPTPRRGARILAAAWVDPKGSVLWGWPEADDGLAGLETSARPSEAVLLAPALSIAATLRRVPSDFGGRFVLVGSGLSAALLREVALDFGLRPASRPGAGERSPLVLLASVSGAGLEEAFQAAADGGRVVALGETDELPAVDFYPNVHRRGLTLHLVPPAPDDSARDLWERGRGRLEAIVAAAVAACRGAESGADPVRPGWVADLTAPGYWIHSGGMDANTR